MSIAAARLVGARAPNTDTWWAAKLNRMPRYGVWGMGGALYGGGDTGL